MDVPPYQKWKRPSCGSFVVFTTVVKLEDSALFGSASWRALDETVARVDASQLRQMKNRHSPATTTASSKQDSGRALEKKRRRASSAASLFNLSCANRLPLCWALPLSAVLFLVSPFSLLQFRSDIQCLANVGTHTHMGGLLERTVDCHGLILGRRSSSKKGQTALFLHFSFSLLWNTPYHQKNAPHSRSSYH